MPQAPRSTGNGSSSCSSSHLCHVLANAPWLRYVQKNQHGLTVVDRRGLTSKIRRDFLAEVVSAKPVGIDQITIVAGDLNIRDEKELFCVMKQDWSCYQGCKGAPDWICVHRRRAQVQSIGELLVVVCIIVVTVATPSHQFTLVARVVAFQGHHAV